MNWVKIFEFEKHDVGIIFLEGKPFFDSYHVEECLDLSKAAIRKAVQRMKPKQKVLIRDVGVGQIVPPENGSSSGKYFITESGVYKLIFKSRSESLIKFISVENQLL